MNNSTTFTSAGSVVVSGKNVVIINSGQGEANIEFASSTTSFPVPKGGFVQLGVITDTLNVSFSNPTGPQNEVSIVESDTGGGANSPMNNLALTLSNYLEVSQEFVYVSELATMNDLALGVDKATTGSGGYNFNASGPSLEGLVAGGGDRVVFQTKNVAANIAGKTSTWLIQCAGLGAVNNRVTKQVGLGYVDTISPYSVKEGIFLQSAKDNAGVRTDSLRFVRFDGFSSVDIVGPILRSDWDDPLDGTGPSGLTWDWDYLSAFEIEILWPGTSVCFYTYIDGLKIEFHKLKWMGAMLGDRALLTSPNQPVFLRMESLSGTDGLNFLGCSIGVDGIQPKIGRTFSEGTGNTPVVLGASGIYYPLLAIRKADVNSFVELANIDILGLSSSDFVVYIVKNPVLDTGSFVFNPPSGSLGSYSKSEFAICDGTQTILAGGYDIAIEITTSRRQIPLNEAISQLNQIGFFINGTSDVFAIVVVPFVNALNVTASMAINEIS